ncbi:hypothetical protein IP91_00405 [Pseudoduganella lurida]|uniref:DUF4124 domain-containing protein n=1 Tax=Pseudoduganella lurida TaxID=1036180 RepID=A0A562RJU9_9BURK|nr:DUF4124 domain-containing protein [Pseudoduganella lurida]TWI69337.1 hypothetical protein IP91_00405 [Pseudoduganella lurida]
MNRLPFLVAASFALPVHAQIYKCALEGKPVTYSEAPCERGRETVLASPAAPAPDRVAMGELKRLQAESKKLEKQRLAQDARQDREDAARQRMAAQKRQRCDKLKLAQKWAEDDARRASPQAAEAARLRARRAGERHDVECA